MPANFCCSGEREKASKASFSDTKSFSASVKASASMAFGFDVPQPSVNNDILSQFVHEAGKILC
jgi:hypothetical protein